MDCAGPSRRFPVTPIHENPDETGIAHCGHEPGSAGIPAGEWPVGRYCRQGCRRSQERFMDGNARLLPIYQGIGEAMPSSPKAVPLGTALHARREMGTRRLPVARLSRDTTANGRYPLKGDHEKP